MLSRFVQTLTRQREVCFALFDNRVQIIPDFLDRCPELRIGHLSCLVYLCAVGMQVVDYGGNPVEHLLVNGVGHCQMIADPLPTGVFVGFAPDFDLAGRQKDDVVLDCVDLRVRLFPVQLNAELNAEIVVFRVNDLWSDVEGKSDRYVVFREFDRRCSFALHFAPFP
jgi:hypothetical protein